MADWLKLCEQAPQMLEKYFKLTQEAEAYRCDEFQAALKIQRLWRGCRVRRDLAHVMWCTLTVQRLWRGVYVRTRVLAWAKQRRQQKQERALQDHMAVVIQRHMRGWLSRRRNENFYRRKAYLNYVTEKSHKLVEATEQYSQEQAQWLEGQRRTQTLQDFESIAQNMHHLVGTQHIMGVYESPYGEAFRSTAFGVPIEDHLKTIFAKRRAEMRSTSEMRATKTASQQLRSHPSDEIKTNDASSASHPSRRSSSSSKQKESQPSHAQSLRSQQQAAYAAQLAQPKSRGNKPILPAITGPRPSLSSSSTSAFEQTTPRRSSLVKALPPSSSSDKPPSSVAVLPPVRNVSSPASNRTSSQRPPSASNAPTSASILPASSSASSASRTKARAFHASSSSSAIAGPTRMNLHAK